MRAVAALLLICTLITAWPVGNLQSAVAQTDISAEGSPEALPSEIDASVVDEVESDLPPESGSGVNAVSLVTPVLLAVSAVTAGDANPCSTIDPLWTGIRVQPRVDLQWTDPATGLGGALHYDDAVDPVVFGWDGLGGGSVGGVIVPDLADVPETSAYFYDYRPFLGAIAGDSGLTAPGGTLSIAYLCVPAPPIVEERATEIPDEPVGEIATEVGSPVESNGSPSTATTPEVKVEPAAIGIGSTVRVTEPLNLRVGPGLSAAVRGVLDTGMLVTVTGGPQSASGYVWWQLATPLGAGWSVVDYLIELPVTVTPISSATATRTPTRTPTVSTGSGIVVGGTVRVRLRLNLREQAGTAAAVVAVMPTGMLGSVLAGPQSANGYQWWQISTSLGTGWAAGEFLDAVAGTTTPVASNTPSWTQTPTPAASNTPTRTQTPTPAASNTPTRTQTTTPAATSTPTWTQTTTPVSSSTSTPTAMATSDGSIAIGDLVRVNSRLNLRSAPGTGSGVITVLPVGSQWPVTDGPRTATGYTWWKLDTTSGAGWVAAPYLARVGVAPTATVTRTPTVSPTASVTRTPTLTSTITLTPTITMTPTITSTPAKCGSFGYGDIVRATDTVNFRAQPSTSGSIIRTLATGERGTVKGGPASANGYTWCQIQVGATMGWVASTFLAKVSGPLPTPNGTVTPRPSPPPPSGGSASVIERGSSSSGMIALTYDAGGDRGYAAYILDLLADYGAHATFGMTGLWAQDNPDLVQRMVNEGHQLINHTWDHPSFTGGSASTTVLTRSGRLDQLDRAEAIVEQLTGYQMMPYWRPPYGDINASVLSDVYAGGYYVTVMWSCDTLGWNGLSEQQILNRCMYPVGAGSIILMHLASDSLDWAATDNMLQYFQNQGLQIVTVEELLGG